MSRTKDASLVLSEYWSDILRHYKEKEAYRKKYQKQSPQLHNRRYLVDLLALIGEHMNLSRTTHHLSIYLLDYFMDNHDIERSRLHLVGLGCLLIASKYRVQSIKHRFCMLVYPNSYFKILLNRCSQICCLGNGCNAVESKALLLEHIGHEALTRKHGFRWQVHVALEMLHA